MLKTTYGVSIHLVIVLRANLDDLGHELVTIGRSFGPIHVHHQLLDNLHQVLLGDHSV